MNIIDRFINKKLLLIFMEKRGQFWYTDYLIGLLVFMVIGFLFFRTVVDISSNNAVMDDLVETGITISNVLMSEGYLYNQWGDGEGRIGFVNNGKVNLSSYNNFTTLVSTPDNYETSKYLIGTKYDYVTYFEYENGTIIQNTVAGKYNDLNLITNAEAIIKFVRFVWYDQDGDNKGKVVKLVVEVWK